MQEYALAYSRLLGTGYEDGMRWVHDVVVGHAIRTGRDMPEQGILARLKEAAGDGYTLESVGTAHKRARDYYARRYKHKAVAGAREALEAFAAMGAPIIITSNSDYRSRAIKHQLRGGGYGDFLTGDNLFCSQRIETLPSGSGDRRTRIILHIAARYPGSRIVYLNDWTNGITTVHRVGGLAAGIVQGESQAQRDLTKRRLAGAGADFIIEDEDGWSELVRSIQSMTGRGALVGASSSLVGVVGTEISSGIGRKGVLQNSPGAFLPGKPADRQSGAVIVLFVIWPRGPPFK